MTRARKFPSLLTAALVTTGVSTAADQIDWTVVDGWDVAYYPGSKGCQAFALFDERTAFFIGYDGKGVQPALDVTMLDKGWDMIGDGVEQPVRLHFGEQAAWTLNMDGVILNDYSGLHILIDAQTPSARQFTREFKQERTMTWHLADEQLGTFSLAGSNNAFKEVSACHEFHRKARAVRSNSLKVRSPKSDDPFAD